MFERVKHSSLSVLNFGNKEKRLCSLAKGGERQHKKFYDTSETDGKKS